MRGKPRRSGGGQERGGGRLNATAALALCVPIRRLLLLDVLANYEGDHSAPPHNFLLTLGWLFLRIRRLETPLRLFTSAETAIFGG